MKYLIGDSHLRFFNQVLETQGKLTPDIDVFSSHAQNLLNIDVCVDGDMVRGTCHQLTHLKVKELELRKGDHMVISGPLHSSLVARHKMWRRTAPWHLAKGRQGISPVSDNVFTVLAQERSQAVIDYLRAGHTIGARVAILEPPFLPRRAIERSGIEETILSTCDKAFRNAVRALCKDAGIDVIPTPPQTHDGDFMLDAFAANNVDDMHHGNHAYVRHAIDGVLAFFDAS